MYIVDSNGLVGDLVVSECDICGKHLGEEHPQVNGNCVDCLADQWGEIIEKSPMVSPQTLYKEA